MAEELNILGELESLRTKQPFEPFTIVTTAGDRYPVTVDHYMTVAINMIVLLPPKSSRVYLRPAHICALEFSD
jgi:hypothetical protein